MLLFTRGVRARYNCNWGRLPAVTSNDKRGGKPVTKKSAVIQEINTVCDLYNLSDIWRSLNKDSSVSHGELNRLKFNIA